MPTLQYSPSAKALHILSSLDGNKINALSRCDLMIDVCKEQVKICTMSKEFTAERLAYWQAVKLEVIKTK